MMPVTSATFDMRYLDWMLQNGASHTHAAGYWDRLANPLGIASWKVLVERVVVVEAPLSKFAKRTLASRLTLSDLFRANDVYRGAR